MLPLLQPGDEVLVDVRAYRNQGPQVGDVVMVQHPHQPETKMVKRVTAVLPNDTYHVEGDNLEHSTDSRTFGFLQRQLILGRVTSLFG